VSIQRFRRCVSNFPARASSRSNLRESVSTLILKFSLMLHWPSLRISLAEMQESRSKEYRTVQDVFCSFAVGGWLLSKATHTVAMNGPTTQWCLLLIARG
jgi:hypothetical protein